MIKKKILFISHTAARTGAPINLLRFLSWLKAHAEMPFRILLQSGGELVPEFEALAPVDILYKKAFADNALWQRFSARLGVQTLIQQARIKIVKERLLRERIGLIYSNTAMNGEVLEWFSDTGWPVISHVHELDYYITYHIGQDSFERIKKYTHHYIAISQAVKKNLIEQHHIAEEQIETIYDFLPHRLLQNATFDVQQQRVIIRQRLNLPEHAFLVCASGTIDWRKGPDLLIQLAAFMKRRYPDLPIYFIWVGGETHGRRYGQLQHDIFRSGVKETVRFLGTQSDPFVYFAVCDLFAMVSREEPFGLVFLEAATFSKPIVCFEGSGGPQEFVEDDSGYVVPYLDVEAMAARCMELFASPELRNRFGQRARQKAQERHAIEHIAPQILKVIQRFLG